MIQAKSPPIHYRSLHWIQSKLPLFFGGEKFVIMDPYFPNAAKELLLHEGAAPLNVVITGGFLATFLNLPEWPSNHYKIWVLCEKAREVLLEVCGLSTNQVGVIPRYALFPLPESPRRLDLDLPLQLVYGGRFARNKGLFNLLSLTQELQEQWGLPVDLHLFGEFSDVMNLSFPKPALTPLDLEKKVRDFIDRHAWMTPPEIKTNLSAEEWISKAPKNSVFINLSMLSHEDFGISLAQAQAAGWPSILSSWGAHWDARTENTLLLPKFELQWDVKPGSIRKKKLAQAILDGITDQPKITFQSEPSPSPEAITPVDMKVYIAIAEKKYPGITKAARMGLRDLIGTNSGKKLFQDYNRIFSTLPSRDSSSPRKTHKLR